MHIAHGVAGDGPIDVVFVSRWVLSNFGVPWQGSAADFYRGMSSFGRLILFDKRGLGMSDRAQGIPDLETRMDDIRAVMDAAGSERAAIMGFSEGGPMSVLFAATFPSGPRPWCSTARRCPGPAPTSTPGRIRVRRCEPILRARRAGAAPRSGATTGCASWRRARPTIQPPNDGGVPGFRPVRAPARSRPCR